MQYLDHIFSSVILSQLVALFWTILDVVDGHGRLVEPPSRSSMWRSGFDTPVNYMDNQLFCGGFMNQWQTHDGKCGVCGDPWQGPRDHEAGGKYARGIIVRRYEISGNITVVVDLTAPHQGYFEFRLCPNDDPRVAVTHDCLDRFPLELADGSGVRYTEDTDMPGFHKIRLRLPRGLECAQCVIQWKYNTGNSWGTDEDGRSCVGCGAQEQFYGCADIAIGTRTLPDDVTLPYWRDEYELYQTTPDMTQFDRHPYLDEMEPNGFYPKRPVNYEDNADGKSTTTTCSGKAQMTCNVFTIYIYLLIAFWNTF